MTDEILGRVEALLGAAGAGTWRAPDGRALPRAAPASDEEWSACLRLASAERWRVLPVGGGTKLGWRGVPAAVDLVLDTARWGGIVAHEPEDGTLTARAGARMQELARAALAGGHHLAPDVPVPAQATLGGVLASGQSGLDRLRYGGVRDALLGARVALADGTLAKSGGRLVKNVTGYDLHRLWCGSEGSLCVVLEASLRLHPAPRERRALAFACDSLARACAAARALAASPARPIAVLVLRERGARGATLHVELGGRPRSVAWEAEDVRERVALPCAEAPGGGEAWAAARAREAPRAAHLCVACLPSALERTLALALEACGDAPLLAHPHLGLATLELGAGAPPDLAGLRARAGPRARFELRGAAGARHLFDDPWEHLRALPPAARALMGELARSFDPGRTFARRLEA